jgi:hypothetical protein
LPVASVFATKTIPEAPCPTFLILAYIDDGSSELTTDRSLSMIWASFIVLIRRSTARDEGGGAVAGVVVVPLLSVGFARCWAGTGLTGGATFGSEGFAAGATGGRGGAGALRSEASCGFGCCFGSSRGTSIGLAGGGGPG